MDSRLARKYFTILYVDDEQENLTTFKATFRRDYNIITANSAAEGLELMQREVVDLVITDQRMPVMTGVEFLKKVREFYPQTVRIIVTGYSDIEAVISAINEGEVLRYITKPWDENDFRMAIENARQIHGLQKENIQTQYNVLKNQINPHFLFNTLSSLMLLIEKDADEAMDFVQKLAKVYRYVLQCTDKDLISMESELEFLQSYLSLIKPRFGDNFQIEIAIEKKHYSKLIPPLSLQLLIENAIKHNIISSKNPLKVQVNIEGDYLMVKNNLQRKSSLNDESSGVGLKNIRNRYRYYTNLLVVINSTEDEFYVGLPMLEKDVLESF